MWYKIAQSTFGIHPKEKEALEFYVKASENNKNEFTTPRFLLKAGQTALGLNNKVDALKTILYFTIRKNKSWCRRHRSIPCQKNPVYIGRITI